MSVYRRAVETDYRLIRGERLLESERAGIAEELLSGAGAGTGEGVRYPVFFVPPEGVRVRSLMGQTPKTMIFAGNLYELEILRLLCLLAPGDARVEHMRRKTLERLRGACFGWGDDGVGECFDTSLVVLRFLCAAAPGDLEWISDRIANYNRHAGDRRRPWFPLWYFWLCLSEAPPELALPEIAKHREELEKMLRRSYVMNSPQDRALHPMLLCMLRNLMGRLPGYEGIRGLVPSIDPRSGRAFLDIAKRA